MPCCETSVVTARAFGFLVGRRGSRDLRQSTGRVPASCVLHVQKIPQSGCYCDDEQNMSFSAALELSMVSAGVIDESLLFRSSKLVLC